VRGLREDAAPHALGQVVADGGLGADDPVRLGVPTALEGAGIPEPAHLSHEGRDDVVEVGVLVRLNPLLGQLQALVLAPPVDEGRDEAGQRASEELVESGPNEWIDPALHVDRERERATDPGVGSCPCRAVEGRSRGLDWSERPSMSSPQREHRSAYRSGGSPAWNSLR
jgi:hypothetical protein